MVAVPVTVNIVIGVEFVDYFSFRAQVAIDAPAQFWVSHLILPAIVAGVMALMITLVVFFLNALVYQTGSAVRNRWRQFFIPAHVVSANLPQSRVEVSPYIHHL
jgi:hypothetical protein